MPYQVRPNDPLSPSGEDPRVSVLSDDEWRRVLALARRHGFDPRGEYAGLLNPEPGESSDLGIAAAQELAVALSEALREETAPRGEEAAGGIRVGPADEPGLQVDWATARTVGEIAEAGSVAITRLPEP